MSGGAAGGEADGAVAVPGAAEEFGVGWVRRAVTRIGAHYTMSKNSVDPAIDPARWALRITVDGRELANFDTPNCSGAAAATLRDTTVCVEHLEERPDGDRRVERVPLRQIVDRAKLPGSIREVAFIGVDGHGDSLPLDYAFSDEVLLAVGMNGETLNRAHGFPLRLLCPRYYGFKNVKWIGEIAFVTEPYFGTWPKMGYTKEPLVKIASFIDKARREGGKIRVGGVSYAGSRGIKAVEVRVSGGEWKLASMENSLLPYTWTRWIAELDARGSRSGGSRAGRHRRLAIGNGVAVFPSGVGGPTLRKVSI